MSSLVENATIKIRRDSASNWTSNNPTPASGEWCIETDTGQVKIGDGSTAWNAKGYHIKNPESFDISASNQVYNLPAVKGGQKEIIKWSGGDGTYKLTFTTQGSDTIGGLAASVWEGEGEGIIVLSDDGGTDWAVQEYRDSGDSGTAKWSKDAMGNQEEMQQVVLSFSSSISSELTINYDRTYVGVLPLLLPGGALIDGVAWINVASDDRSLSSGFLHAWAQGNGSTSGTTEPFSVLVKGRWR